ncbi:MAG: type II secretion system protein [Candidatus Hydrogenedentota bacterium]
MSRLSSAKRDGFTLIELLVVCAIIGVLAAVSLSNIKHALRKAREGRTWSHLASLRTAINVFFTMKGVNYSYNQAGANSTGGFPWSLREGPGVGIPNNGEQWSGDDSNGTTIEKGAFGVFLINYIDHIPMSEVSDDGTVSFWGGQTNWSNGVWQCNIAGVNPNGNWRGWHYVNVEGRVRVNNTMMSTEGRTYDSY